MALQIAILGVVEARIDGTLVSVPAGKQLSLLTLLALHAPHPVPTEVAGESLWPEAAPRETIRNLQVTVWRLRRALGPAGVALETVPPGYRLAVQADAVDARRFESLIEESRTARAAGDPVAARRSLDQAMEMWRGPPLLDVSFESFTQGEIARLEELHLTALEERIELRLREGEHAALVAELEQLSGAHPYRERLVSLLMLALYECGRQTDALAVYRDARGRLVEEFGLEPGPALRDLERAILEHRVPRHARQRPLSRATGGRGLPPAPNRTIGRTREVAQIVDTLRRGPSDLLTLTGPGGVGKTRLALEIARTVEGEFADGARFVSLAALRRAEEVSGAFVSAIGVLVVPGESAEQAVTRFLDDKNLLLVVDNCEHLLSAAPFIRALSLGAPGVSVLATSREPLAVASERCFPVEPLALPGGDTPANEVEHADAVALFCERMRAHDAGLNLSEPDLVPIAQICRRVDGLPLAIELAAARCTLLSPAEMAQRLQDAIGGLGTASRDAPSRHRTLRATIKWSHDLLDGTEQQCFAQFAVFRGGATIEAAEAITTGGLETLERLVSKNLITRRQTDGVTRLGMLETVREYAAEQLSLTSDKDDVAARHHRYFLTLATHEGNAPALMGPHQRAHRARLDAEAENFAAALSWATTMPSAEPALSLCAGLSEYWLIGEPHHQDAVHWSERCLAMPDAAAHPALRVPVLCLKAWAVWHLGRRDKLQALEAEAEAIARALDDPVLLSPVLQLRAAMTEGEQAKIYADEALDLARTQSAWERALAATTRATCATSMPELRERVDEATALLRATDNLTELLALLIQASGIALELSRPQDAKGFLARAMPLARRLDSPRLWLVLYVNLGMAALLTSDVEAADDAFRKELRLCRCLGIRMFARMGMLGLAALATLHGDDDFAARLTGAAKAHSYGEPLTPDETMVEATFLQPARNRFGSDAWDVAVADGATMSFEYALAYAIGNGSRGGTE